MPINEGDLATLSESDVMKLRIENRAWSKTIRLCMAALVNRRMANQISYEEYAASRKAAKDERAECDRTTVMLGG